MKRFIAISLLWATSLPLLACAWPATHNYYLFSPCSNRDFRERVEQTTEDNWQAYLGTQEEYFSFDADAIIKAARRKGDALMASYVGQLQKYLACADEKRREQWDYPTKAQLARRTQTLKAVRAYAQGKLTSRLRSQHALLLMRCNMMLGQHQANVSFYEQTGSKLIESVYRDMMRNIYAGALLKTGRDTQAAQIFAEQGDWESLMTQYYKRRSYAAIRQEYLRDANSAVLPFLLKDFVNNAQEAVDGPDAMPGKLFVRDIQRQEAMQMCQLAQEVVAAGKSGVPALWQSAKAWLEYLYGRHRQAAADIVAAAKMGGTERMKDNARVLMLYITAAEAKGGTDLDNYVATELQWMDDRQRQQPDDRYWGNAKDRLVHQVLADKYADSPVRAAGLLRAADSQYFDAYIDTMGVDRLQQYIASISATAATPLDKYLQARQQVDRDMLNDLVGTKYLRLCQWTKAVEWLQRVPLSYYSSLGYAVYAVNRRYTVEPWITRQWLKQDLVWGDTKWQLTANPKINFAREMTAMEGELSVLAGEARCQRCYDLAVRYAQASITGDCWFLMHNGKSVSDTVRVNETDLAAKAVALLQEASLTANLPLKERALFALCYGGLYRRQWYDEVWNDATYEFDHKPNPASANYQAFATLRAFEQQHAGRTSRYVSRCDEFIQFCKQHK